MEAQSISVSKARRALYRSFLNQTWDGRIFTGKDIRAKVTYKGPLIADLYP